MNKKEDRVACDHLGIFTQDPERLIRFYTQKMGFDREKDSLIPRSVIEPIFGIADDCRLIRLALKNLKLELFSPLKASLKKPCNRTAGYNHFGLSTGSRDDFCRKLRRKKVKIIAVKRNSHKVYFVKDPDGNLIEIRD